MVMEKCILTYSNDEVKVELEVAAVVERQNLKDEDASS